MAESLRLQGMRKMQEQLDVQIKSIGTFLMDEAKKFPGHYDAPKLVDAATYNNRIYYKSRTIWSEQRLLMGIDVMSDEEREAVVNSSLRNFRVENFDALPNEYSIDTKEDDDYNTMGPYTLVVRNTGRFYQWGVDNGEIPIWLSIQFQRQTDDGFSIDNVSAQFFVQFNDKLSGEVTMTVDGKTEVVTINNEPDTTASVGDNADYQKLKLFKFFLPSAVMTQLIPGPYILTIEMFVGKLNEPPTKYTKTYGEDELTVYTGTMQTTAPEFHQFYTDKTTSVKTVLIQQESGEV